MNPKLLFGRCSKKQVDKDSKEAILIREIKKAKDDLASAETAWAWANPEHVDVAIALVDATRLRYQALVREYKSLNGE